jgi:hypothetical protein
LKQPGLFLLQFNLGRLACVTRAKCHSVAVKRSAAKNQVTRRIYSPIFVPFQLHTKTPLGAGLGFTFLRRIWTTRGSRGALGAVHLALVGMISHRAFSGCDGHHILSAFPTIRGDSTPAASSWRTLSWPLASQRSRAWAFDLGAVGIVVGETAPDLRHLYKSRPRFPDRKCIRHLHH